VQITVPGPAAKRWADRTVLKAFLLGVSAAFLAILVAFYRPTRMLSNGLFALAAALLAPSLQ